MVQIGKNSSLAADLFEEEDTQKDKYLTFKLGKEDFGVEICHITEIIGLQKITEVPDMPDFVRGVINLRGKVIPVMDMRTRFKMPPMEYHDRTCIIVIDFDGKSVGLVVDRVNDVANIPASQIEPPPCTGRNTASRYIQGMGKSGEDVKILLDIKKILFDEELEQLEALTPKN